MPIGLGDAPKPLGPSAQDVARLARVSQSAVSRAFTEGASISDRMREKVMTAAAELGYRPNLLARSLIKGRSNIIGVGMGNLENPFFMSALDALSTRLAAAGKHLLVFTAQLNSQVDAQIDHLLKYRVEALVLLSTTLSSSLAVECRSAGIPVVLFNRRAGQDDGIDSVTGDNHGGAREIARHLLTQGYRRLAFMAGWPDSSTSHDREAAFVSCLAEHGVEPPLRAVGHFQRAGAIAAARELLARPDRPDAIFCANDLMAFATIDVARSEFGLAIGRDLGVAGFDDIAMAAWPAFDLTSYSQPLEAMADRAVAMLIAETPLPATRAVLPGELRVRSSTCRD